MQLTESFHSQPPALRIGFWLVEAFDLYTLANALEPLRVANQVAGRSVCHWLKRTRARLGDKRPSPCRG